ncbi:MAG: hypothetical protein J6B30_04530, partial [Muribaculaceae bacterium]|nr:hypothetical protein [Muribaculaceae bacterium]
PKINGISDQLWNAITKAMSVRRNQRPQSAAELMNLLPSANAAKNAPDQQPAQPKTPVASNDKTMVESAAHQATYAPAQDASASTSLAEQQSHSSSTTVSDANESPNKNSILLIPIDIIAIIIAILFLI